MALMHSMIKTISYAFQLPNRLYMTFFVGYFLMYYELFPFQKLILIRKCCNKKFGLNDEKNSYFAHDLNKNAKEEKEKQVNGLNA